MKKKKGFASLSFYDRYISISVQIMCGYCLCAPFMFTIPTGERHAHTPPMLVGPVLFNSRTSVVPTGEPVVHIFVSP